MRPSASALHSPLPSARCRVWVGVWPAAPCLLLSGCGKVHALASALSARAAEMPELLCLELAEWPEDDQERNNPWRLSVEGCFSSHNDHVQSLLISYFLFVT